MAGVRFKAEMLGRVQLDRTLLNVRKRLTDLRPAFDEAHEVFLFIERRLFNSEGATGRRGPWARYGGQPRYERWQTWILGDARPVLQFGNGLRSRLPASLVDGNHPEHYYRKQPLSAEMGSSVPYIDRLAEGGVNRFGGPMPQRYAIDISDADAEELVRPLIRFVQTGKVRG